MTCKDCGWKYVNSDGELFCGYSNARTGKDESCCAWKPVRVGTIQYTEEDWKKTRADRIRSMSDEELATLIGDNIDCSICKKEVFGTATCPGSLTADGKDCHGCWLDWLKREVE